MPRLLWRVVEWRLSRHMPPRHLGPALGDLAEDYAARRRSSGRLRADWWLLRESRSLASAYRMRALGERSSSSSRATVDALRFDLGQAWRAIRGRPAATLATATVLTLGIGLVSAMFALADPYLLRPLPYSQPDALVALYPSVRTLEAPPPTLDDWRRRTDLFARLAAWSDIQNLDVSNGDRGAVIPAVSVSPDFLPVLGVPMAAPADWRQRDDSAETPILLTTDVARRLFGPDAPVGRALKSAPENGHTYRVAGVLPSTFLFPSLGMGGVGGLIPLGDVPLVRVRRSLTGQTVPDGSLRLLARVQPGVTPERVSAALSTTTARGREATEPGVRVVTDWLPVEMRGRLRPLALGALGAGLLILAVCAANIANLLLARGASRVHEFATRQALGASGYDLARLVFIELGCLAIMGIGGGLLLAAGAIAVVATVIPSQFTTLGAPALTWRVVWFACASGGVVMAAGIVPAWAAWRVAPATILAQSALAESKSMRRLRYGMVMAQSAVAVVLLVGAAMLVRSYAALFTQDTGYAGDTFAVRAVYPRSLSVDAVRADIIATVERLRHLPGVSSAAATSGPLVENLSMGGAASLTVGTVVVPRARAVPVTSAFFDTMRSRLITGRLPAPDDHARTAVVSATLAAMCCPDASPVGRVLLSGSRPLEIVGVIGDIYDNALDQHPMPRAFVPIETSAAGLSTTTYVLRVERVGPDLGALIAREISAVNRDASVADGSTLRDRLLRSVGDRSFTTLVLTFFAVAAVSISAAGLVGVVSFAVARRTREIAIRRAIGASASHVRVLVAREAATAAGLGAIIGFAVGTWLSRTLQSFLYGIHPGDALSLVSAAAVMLAVVVIAAWIPARRALRLSPTIALRTE